MTLPASEEDGDARWVKHKGKPAIHGVKAHVGADADTALIEKIAVTFTKINDSRAGPDGFPDNPGKVFADSAYRGSHFRDAVRAKGVSCALSQPAWGAATNRRCFKNSKTGTSRSTGCGAGSRRSSEHGNEAMACAGCDGAGSPKPDAKSTLPPSPTTSNGHSISCNLPDGAEVDARADTSQRMKQGPGSIVVNA